LTLCEEFQRTAGLHSDRVALRTPGGAVEVTWATYAERVRALAGGLGALGVARGEAVALMLTNRPEFSLCDTAALHLGATPFSVYNTLPSDQIQHLFANAGNRVVICERQFAPRVLAAREGTRVEHVVCLEGAGPGTIALEQLEATPAPPGFDFEAAWRAVEPGDVATLIYTSGTTGPPKGVELTHANLLAQVHATRRVLPVSAEDRSTSYLPSAHIADRWLSHYTQMLAGHQVTFIADVREVIGALPELRPTFWGAVPRVWEKLMAALQAGGVVDPSALDERARAAVRARLGLDQVRWLICGAAPIPTEALEYFLALGLEICELWGMSELSCCATINPPGAVRIGTVGKPIPGVEVRLAEDGELLARGAIVMRGYRGEPHKTAEAIDPDGWMHTGDVAQIDADGYVKIIDRKKELIINAAGKNMSPANIEQTLKSSSPLIGQAVCVGDRRPYNVALLVLDPENLAGRDPHDPDVLGEIETAVQRANARLSRVEQIKRYHVLEHDWEPGGEELTPTMKLKRRVIETKYSEEIESLYAVTLA
jgi:long-chain acyl-CoA synthetase